MRRALIALLLVHLVTTSLAVAAMQSDPARPPRPVTVPEGTTINVRLTQALDVDVAHAGQTLKARVDDPILIDGRMVIPREAAAVVQAVRVAQSGTFKGSDQVSLKLNTVSFGGRVYEVATEYATVSGGGEGKRTARKVGGGAGLGALFGSVGGGEGALIGAAVGAVAGGAVAASGEEHLRLEAETRLQFRLTSSIRVQP
jgi:hypothetical protein